MMKTFILLLSIFSLMGVGVLGYHLGASDKLGILNDQKAVQNLRLPRARFDFTVTNGRVGKTKWKMVTLENKLECVRVGQEGAYAAWGSCNWSKWNAEKEAADKAK